MKFKAALAGIALGVFCFSPIEGKEVSIQKEAGGDKLPILLSISRPFQYFTLEVYPDSLVKVQLDNDSSKVSRRAVSHTPKTSIPFLDSLLQVVDSLPSFSMVDEENSLRDSFLIQVKKGSKTIICKECTGEMDPNAKTSLAPQTRLQMKRVKNYLKTVFGLENDPM